MNEVTPEERFALHSLTRGARANEPLAQVVRHATYWESFPHSYTEEQVRAAVALHHSVRSVGSETWDAAFLAVARLAGLRFPALARS
jgi:hypothetical protein